MYKYFELCAFVSAQENAIEREDNKNISCGFFFKQPIELSTTPVLLVLNDSK